MINDHFDAFSVAHRETARSALAVAFDSSPIDAITAITGGASGAATFRVEAGGQRYLLQIEARQVRCAIRTNISPCASQRRQGLPRGFIMSMRSPASR